MTTLLQEFEEWLKSYDKYFSSDHYNVALQDALEKLEELKKKHNVT